MTWEHDAEVFAHRAVASATMLGLLGRGRTGLRVTVGELADGVDRDARASDDRGPDVVVLVDEQRVPDAALQNALARVRSTLGDGTAAALVVASPVTVALVSSARRDRDRDRAAQRAGDDAFSQGLRWAGARADMALAPALDPERLARIVDAATAAGLVLVEREVGPVPTVVTHARTMRSPRARAVLATIALGASARPLLFVPQARAPKGGLVRAKSERFTDSWVSAGIESPGDEHDEHDELARAALDVLGDAARAGRRAVPFKELLRESREKWAATARARGQRATHGSEDAPALAAALDRLAADDRVHLHALDPSKPDWTLTIGPPRPI